MQAFSSYGEQGLLSSCGKQASHCNVYSHFRAQARGCLDFSSCSVRASLPRSMWNIPGPGIEPVSPALADRLLITEPPGKSQQFASNECKEEETLVPDLETMS